MNVGAAPAELSLRRPIAISAAAHLVIAAGLLLRHAAPTPPVPPTYRVSLVAAPPGPRALGVVQPATAASPTPPAAAAPSPATPTPAPVPARTAAVTPGMRAPPTGKTAPAPRRVAAPVTPAVGGAAKPAAVVPAASIAPAAPRAGGGPVGGKGADVANVQVDGIAFPYPGYLDNVVRQIAIRFRPAGGGSLTAAVAFLIRRDGSVTGLRLTTRSGVYSFDTEAMGAVDAAAHDRAFGPLPQGFSDDVLPVIFSFDPRLIR